MSGYTITPRGLWDNGIFADEPFSEREAYLWLRENANYADKPYRHKSCLITIHRGELPYTLLGLAAKFKWSRGKTRRFLEVLEKAELIGQRTDTGATIITICNYDIKKDTETDGGHQVNHSADISRTLGGHTLSKGTKETKEREREAASCDAPAPAPVSKVARQGRKTRLTAEFIPPRAWCDYAVEFGYSEEEAGRMASVFKDHWLAKGEPHLDWDATWRNWVRRQLDFDTKQAQRAGR